MFGEPVTIVATFRIDKADWDDFCNAVKDDHGAYAKPSQKVRHLIQKWLHERKPIVAAAAPPAPPPTKKKAKPAKKKAKSEKRSTRG